MFTQNLLQFVVDVLKVPSILVGLVAFFGLIAQKKPFPDVIKGTVKTCLLYTSPSPRDATLSRMPSSA